MEKLTGFFLFDMYDLYTVFIYFLILLKDLLNIRVNIVKDYLVILAGSPRGGEKTWSSLKKYVIDPLDADLAICTTDRFNQDSSLFEIATYKWIFKELDNFFEYYEENFNNNWREYFNLGLDTGLYSSGSIHFVFKDYILKNHIDVVEGYRNIIYSRFDQLYVDIHPRVESESILIPEGEDYFGICDRHAAFPSKYSKQFLNICEFIDSDDTKNYNSDFLNCEVTFLNHLKNIGLIDKVKRAKRLQFTTSLKGEHTNWRIAKYKVHFTNRLMIKYPDEFMDSMRNLISANSIYYALRNETIYTINYLYLAFRIFIGKKINKRD